MRTPYTENISARLVVLLNAPYSLSSNDTRDKPSGFALPFGRLPGRAPAAAPSPPVPSPRLGELDREPRSGSEGGGGGGENEVKESSDIEWRSVRQSRASERGTMGCDQVLGPKMASLHVRIMKSDLPERWPAQSSAPYSSAIPDVQILDTTRRRKWTTDSLARRALPRCSTRATHPLLPRAI